MDRKYIDDNHVVARYLADQLTDEERGQFEAHLREHPEVVADLEAAARFKVGLGALADQGKLDEALRARSVLIQPRWLALAAAVAIAFVAGALWLNRSPTRGPVLAGTARELLGEDARPLPVAARHVLLRTRSEYDSQIALPAAPSSVELHILPEAATPNRPHGIALYTDAATGERRKVAELRAVTADAEGYVPAFVRTDRLVPGRYALEVWPADAPDAKSAFSIKVVRATSP